MTLVAIVRHQSQPGQMHQAADRIRSNGDRMAVQPGFVSRELLAAADGSDELATVTTWESVEAYDEWTAVNRATNVHAGTVSPYVGSPMTTLYVPYTDQDPASP